mmetsp:Transcript_467/g.1518  ORF Transcript_467/g.1518 Transcript_467/m.1518 type:complete len:279 (-) Transcript_467:250-1086(-)
MPAGSGGWVTPDPGAETSPGDSVLAPTFWNLVVERTFLTVVEPDPNRNLRRSASEGDLTSHLSAASFAPSGDAAAERGDVSASAEGSSSSNNIDASQSSGDGLTSYPSQFGASFGPSRDAALEHGDVGASPARSSPSNNIDASHLCGDSAMSASAWSGPRRQGTEVGHESDAEEPARADIDDGRDGGALRSLGSRLHASGQCRPCIYALSMKDRCARGADCSFCHEYHKKVRSRPKKRGDSEITAQSPGPGAASTAGFAPASPSSLAPASPRHNTLSL